PDPRIGTWDDVDAVREKLRARGMGVVVDFVANHTGRDFPWIQTHPDRYVRDAGGIAQGRDPFFPPCTDTAQLDYFNPDTRSAMIAELGTISRHVDGVRCDMAMLALNDVFARTWGSLVGPAPPGEFWTDARAAVPDLL